MTTIPSLQLRTAAAREAPRPLSWGLPLFLPLSRLILFALMQVIIFAVLSMVQPGATWTDAAAWWMIGVILANLVSVALLAWALRREDLSLRDLYRLERGSVVRDALINVTTGLMVWPASIP